MCFLIGQYIKKTLSGGRNGCKCTEKRTCPSVVYRGMSKINSEGKNFAYDIHSVSLTQPCANGLHFGVNPDFKSPQGMTIRSIYLCATREQDGDLQRCMVKYQMILLFGVYFSYLKPEERTDQCIIYCELKETRLRLA